MRSYGVARGETIKLVYLADMLQAMLLVYMLTGSFVDFGYFDVLYYLVAIVIILKDLVLRPSNELSLAAPVAAQPAQA